MKMRLSFALMILAATAIVATSGCSQQAPTTSAAAPAKASPAAGGEPQHIVMTTQAQREAGVETMELKPTARPEVVRSTARLTNDENRTWRVGAITEGRIVAVLANPGDFVKKDQILARMHSHEIHESRAEYGKAQANLARKKGLVDYSARLRDRAKRLYDLKAGSLEQVERAETELRNAETEAGNAQIELERTRNHLTEFLGVDANAPAHPAGADDKDDPDLIPVKAPATGIILTRAVTPGTVVTSSTDQFTISDLSRLWAIAEVNEEYLGKLRVGMPVRVQVQAYAAETFRGRIGKIGDVLDPATRTVKVRVELNNSKGRLKPEMYATTEIELGSTGTGLVVPSEAVQEVRGKPSVFVKMAGDRFELREIQTGKTLDGDVEVLGGIKSGDVIASRATFVLKSEFLKASIAGE